MKFRPFANLGRVLAVCLVLALNVSAQQPVLAPQPPLSRLVVQIVYKKGAQPAYLTVPGSAWYAWFGVTPAASARSAADTVQAVDLKTKLEGGRVELKVGVHVGARFFDRFDEVATYTAAEGETVEARALEGVGVEPFSFKVLRVSASDTAAPTVDNRTQSIAASVTGFTPDPLPRAKLTLTNLSPKRVRAVEMRTVFEGRVRTSMIAFEPEGKPLMEPGGTYERKVGVTDGRTNESGFAPQAVEGVIILAVVFEDYSYEGDADAAARKLSMDEGERAQLPRLLRLIREAQAAGGAETVEAVNKFRAALAALDDAAPQSSLDAVHAAHPGLPARHANDVRVTVEVSMHHVRTELLKDLERFEQQLRDAPAADNFKRGLVEQQARYEGWLARL
jgi:hypothetical protein